MPLSDRLQNELRATLPGASDDMIRQMIWNAVSEACREGFIWRETVPVTLDTGHVTYNANPDGAEILHVFSVAHETMDLNANPVLYEFGSINLKTAPTLAEAATPLFVVAALTPALDAGTDIENLIPADMWSEHHAMFYRGVMSLMLAQPSKPYTNPQLAAYYSRDFYSRLARAKHKVETGGVPGAQRWRYNNWAPKALR